METPAAEQEVASQGEAQDAVEVNALIERFTVAINNGFLTAGVHLETSAGKLIFGGHALYLSPAYSNHRLESLAGHFLFKLLQLAGVADSNELTGHLIRARVIGDKVVAIGHAIQDEWFNPEVDFAEVIARDEALLSEASEATAVEPAVEVVAA